MWRFFCLFCFSKKSSFRNTWIICEFNETSANTLSKKKLGKLKKNCYNFFAVSFLCNQCFSFLTQNHQHLFCNDSMPSNFDLWLKKKNMTTKTIHFFFSLRIQLMFCQQFWDFVVWFWYLFVVFFFPRSISKLRNPSTVCTVLALCSPVILQNCCFLCLH